MKLHLMTDLEGVAGVYQWEDREGKTREREIEATDILDLMGKLRGHNRAWNPM